MVWQPGETGNNRGSPGVRDRIGNALLRDFEEGWREHGASVVARVAAEKPEVFLTLGVKLLPKEHIHTITDPLREAIELLARRAGGAGTLAGPTIDVRDGGDRGDPGALAGSSSGSLTDARPHLDQIGPRCWEIDAAGMASVAPSCDALTVQGGHDSPDRAPVERRAVGGDSDVASTHARELAKSILPD